MEIACKFMENDDSEWNEVEFLGIYSYDEGYESIESYVGEKLLRNQSFDS